MVEKEVMTLDYLRKHVNCFWNSIIRRVIPILTLHFLHLFALFFTLNLSDYRNYIEMHSQSSVLDSKQNKNDAHSFVKETSVLYANVSGQLYNAKPNVLT